MGGCLLGSLGAFICGAQETVGLKRPMGPSEKSWREPPYTRMTLEDIELFKRQIINCAVLLKKAGFDGVEVMAGVGGIMNRFLSLATNDRTDQYGGSLENRAKLTLEVFARNQGGMRRRLHRFGALVSCRVRRRGSFGTRRVV